MKITIDARLYGLENAGLGRYVMKLIEHLGKIDKRNKYSLLLRKKYFEELALPAGWTKVLAEYRHYSLAEQIKLPKIISETKPDLVHFPHFNVPLTFRGRFLVTIHDLLMHKTKGADATTLAWPVYLIKRFGYKRVFNKAVKDSQKIIVPSGFVKRELTNFYKVKEEKIVVTYEGVDSPKISGSSPQKYSLKEKYFIYAGNAYPHKNLARLIEAVAVLNKNHSEKVLLVIASARNVFTQRLEKLVKNLRAESFVRLLGFVPDADLFSLYQNSVGFVFPSLSEGFGLPGLEAMVSGAPVLASDIGVFKEIYKVHAVYFNPYDFSSIEKALQGMLNMPVEEKKLRIMRAREFAQKYSWEKMAHETLAVYKEAAKE